MRDIKVLDCTLRDGGFVNGFNFGKKVIRNIFSRLSKALVDIIEVGYLYDKEKYDSNYTRFYCTDAIKEVLGDKQTNSMVVAIIDYGDCSLNSIKPASNSNLDGIRVTFKKTDVLEAAHFCKSLKEKGYKVFMQPVSVTTYADQDILNLVKIVNKISPFAVSIVDTYGLMHSEKVLHYFSLLDQNLNENITIGFHSHNNFQMAYANCIQLVDVHSNRPLILDASCYGMGKSAGNTCTELICMYLNENHEKNYQLSEILEAIDANIIPIYQSHPWGYCHEYYISAQTKTHPKYIQFLENKHTLSVSAIDSILLEIPEKDKLDFNENLIDNMYLNYQNKFINDTDSFQKLLHLISDKKVLLLGPGNSLKVEGNDILEFIESKKPFVVSLNCVPPNIPSNLVFLSNSKRYEQLEDELFGSHFVVAGTSNITPIKPFDFTFNYVKLIDEKCKIMDTALLMFLNVLQKLPVEEIYLAGFDGFSSQDKNFYDSYLDVSALPYTADELTDEIGQKLMIVHKHKKLSFLTHSLYQRYIR